MGVVLTIAAAGSEMSDSSVITKEEGGLKRSVKSDLSRPRFAVMNPELTYTLPPYQTASGCTDILMHTMERYFTPRQGQGAEFTDGLAESLLRTVMASARVLRDVPLNYDARAHVMWAGSLSHNGLTGCGTLGDWATHQLEHELGGMFDVAHGAGLAAMWGSWARYVYREDPARFARFARTVMGLCDVGSQEQTALAGIEAFEGFLRDIRMPVNLPQLGLEVTDAQIDELAYKCTFMGKRTIGSFKVLGEEDIKAIYRMAR